MYSIRRHAGISRDAHDTPPRVQHFSAFQH